MPCPRVFREKSKELAHNQVHFDRQGTSTPHQKRMFGKSKTDEKAEWVQSAMTRYERPLLQYSYSIVRDLERARDVVQETFMRLHKQEKEAIEGHLSQWLFTVCRNCSLKVLRAQDRYIHVDGTEFEGQSSDAPSPAEDLERKERIARLMSLLKELTPNQQEVVRLRFQNFHSYQEISEITGLTVGNVGFILNAAMRNLRSLMERDEREEKIIYLTKVS